jgi:hypothetical protein
VILGPLVALFTANETFDPAPLLESFAATLDAKKFPEELGILF